VQQQQLAADSLELTAAYYPAALWSLVRDILGSFSRGVWVAVRRNPKPAVLISSDSSSSSSSTSQAAASAALLAVVLARSLVQLADAVEAAGPQLLFECQMRQPAFKLKWSPAGQVHSADLGVVLPHGSAAQQNVSSQWQFWQLAFLHALQPVMFTMATLGMLELAAGDAQDRAAAAAAAGDAQDRAAAAAVAGGPDVTAASGSNPQATNASSSSSTQLKWGHLLYLQQFSPEWAAAVAAFNVEWPGWWRDDIEARCAVLRSGAPLLLEGVQSMYDDALQLTKTLVDTAPLPAVCNNPKCEGLSGVSEAAAACKACAVCMCRYCSVTCQRADWKRHKPACKRLAAAGLTCACG
jgi:hypothetical protein